MEADADCVVVEVDTGDAVIDFVEVEDVVELGSARVARELTVEDETAVDEDSVALAFAVGADEEVTLLTGIGVVEVLAKLVLIALLAGTIVEKSVLLVLAAATRLALVVEADRGALVLETSSLLSEALTLEDDTNVVLVVIVGDDVEIDDTAMLDR